MIDDFSSTDFEEVLAVINDGASAYKGVIPENCWHEPYMPPSELREGIEAGIKFRVCRSEDNNILGVMGVQPVQDVYLIRHAYVKTDAWRNGIGSRLIEDINTVTDAPVLIGTWAAAKWAIQFYERHGFHLLDAEETRLLLKKYWSVPDLQIEHSVVLADQNWLPA
ncbi:MAG: GNAT family N-acetyltransferase [Rhodospirillaceae bacterium]|nr:GNAT family N-acetyltransferase [Rhodospirillaceae bacterium]|tara:strand:+ start:6812 stop:7309 length:498 start_codon:yes stop_codon:yes gene_type:complete